MLAKLADLQPQERHALLTPLITPRPIAFVSTVSTSGASNVAPFSFFAMGGQSPQSVAFCPVADRNGNPKDTLRNIKETGEFVINIVTRAMAERVNQASAPYPHGVDEFEIVGFGKLPSVAVKPARVAESPAHLECRVFQIIPHGAGPLHGTWVIGEVIVAHIDDAYLAADGLPDTAKLDPAARLGRTEWSHVTADSMFSLTRPTIGRPSGQTPG